MQHLAVHFGISVGLVHKIIHRYIYILHAYVVPKYIRWHSMPHWRRLAGEIPDWPNVVSFPNFLISFPTTGSAFNFMWHMLLDTSHAVNWNGGLNGCTFDAVRLSVEQVVVVKFLFFQLGGYIRLYANKNIKAKRYKILYYETSNTAHQ